MVISKDITRDITRVTPFRALMTLLITYLLSPLPLQVVSEIRGLRVSGLGFSGVRAVGFEVRALGFRDLGFRVQCLRLFGM